MWEVVEIEKQPRQLEGTGSGSRVQFKEGGVALACRARLRPRPTWETRESHCEGRQAAKEERNGGALTLASRTAGRRARDGGLRTGRPSNFQPMLPPNATVAHTPTLTATATRVEAASMVATQALRSTKVRVASVGLIICHSLSNRQHHRPELSNHNCTKKWAKSSNGRWQSHENLLTPPLVKTVALLTVRARSNATTHLLDPHRFVWPSSSNANWLRSA